jgi:hypothetical protein
VIPAEDREHIGCLDDQVKLARALVRDLDEAVKEIKQLGNHGEEASQKITEHEALCKQKEDTTINSSIVIIILTHAVESILVGHLHDQLITGLEHSLQPALEVIIVEEEENPVEKVLG